MGDLTSGDIALILWGIYLVVLLFRMAVWCAKGAVEETSAALLETVDNAIKRGTEQGIELAKQDALARAKERREI